MIVLSAVFLYWYHRQELIKSPKYQENVEDGRIWHGCADRESSLQGILLWLMVDHNTIDKSVVILVEIMLFLFY